MRQKWDANVILIHSFMQFGFIHPNLPTNEQVAIITNKRVS